MATRVRIKIERTPEFQSQYTGKGFGAKDVERLRRTAKREVFEVVSVRRQQVPALITDKCELFPVYFYEIVETGECASTLLG